MIMNNTIAWVIVVLAALVSAAALSAASLWTVREDNKDKAFIKLVLTALLFAAVVFLMSFLTTIVHL